MRLTHISVHQPHEKGDNGTTSLAGAVPRRDASGRRGDHLGSGRGPRRHQQRNAHR